jgi:hypothetical protein
MNTQVPIEYQEHWIKFWKKIEKRGSPRIHPFTQCWAHTTAPSSNGYGQIWIQNKPWNLHRLSWFLHNGCPTDELDNFYNTRAFHVAHLCDNKECCNPEHLELQPVITNVGNGVKLRDSKKDKPVKIKREGNYKKTSGALTSDMTKGESNVKAILTKEQVIEIRRRYVAGLKYGELKKMVDEFGVKYVTLQAIVGGRIWDSPEYFP